MPHNFTLNTRPESYAILLHFLKFTGISQLQFWRDFLSDNAFFPSRILGYYAIGALFCTLTTELAKYNVGRLRPYFLTVCQPDLSKEACLDAYGYQKFVTNYTCHNADVKMVREARKSFLSGHSSFSFYCATFIIMYLYVPTT